MKEKALYIYACGSLEGSQRSVSAFAEETHIAAELRPVQKSDKFLSKFNTQDNQIITLATFGEAITHEIKFGTTHKKGADYIQPKVGYVIHQLTNIICPSSGFAFFCADKSWRTVSKADSKSINILAEFTPPALSTFKLNQLEKISSKQLKWAIAKWPSYVLMKRDNEAFDLASDILCNYHRTLNPRLVAVDLWTAIESLCSIDHGLRSGIALNLSYFIFDKRSKRVAMYKKLKKLYDVRSNIVHGRSISNVKLVNHIQEVREVLALTIKKCVDKETTPTVENLFL